MFQAKGNTLNSKQKQQNTKFKVKEIDLIWSRICSSLIELRYICDTLYLLVLAHVLTHIVIYV